MRLREARVGSGPAWSPRGGPAAPAVSARGRLGPTVWCPQPGPNLPRTPASWTPNVEPWRPLGFLAPLLFLSPGFQAEFGEVVWAKVASKDAS